MKIETIAGFFCKDDQNKKLSNFEKLYFFNKKLKLKKKKHTHIW